MASGASSSDGVVVWVSELVGRDAVRIHHRLVRDRLKLHLLD